MSILAEHFGRDAHNHRSEWLHQKRWFVKARNAKTKREEVADQVEEDIFSLATSVIMATDVQIQQFEAKLDIYDEATVRALMGNQEMLDLVTARMNKLLERAYVMDDGRRAFKTENGTQVFDEFGAEVSQDQLDYTLIGPEHPVWEAYQPDLQEKLRLETERTEILEYQEKLDSARERTSEGDISEEELNELDADLSVAMPSAVKLHVPGLADNDHAASIKTDFAASTNPPALITRAPFLSPNVGPGL